MMKHYGIAVNLDRCIGCFACEVACKQENNVSTQEQWIKVHQLGPEEIDNQLHMEFLPQMTEQCTLCHHRVIQGIAPACVSICPVQALTFGTTDVMLRELKTGKRCQVTKLAKIDVPARKPGRVATRPS